jgi:hypothetical protein
MDTLEEVYEILYVPSIIDGVKKREIREGWKKCVQFRGRFFRTYSVFPSIVLMAWLQTKYGQIWLAVQARTFGYGRRISG